MFIHNFCHGFFDGYHLSGFRIEVITFRCGFRDRLSLVDPPVQILPVFVRCLPEGARLLVEGCGFGHLLRLVGLHALTHLGKDLGEYLSGASGTIASTRSTLAECLFGPDG